MHQHLLQISNSRRQNNGKNRWHFNRHYQKFKCPINTWKIDTLPHWKIRSSKTNMQPALVKTWTALLIEKNRKMGAIYERIISRKCNGGSTGISFLRGWKQTRWALHSGSLPRGIVQLPEKKARSNEGIVVLLIWKDRDLSSGRLVWFRNCRGSSEEEARWKTHSANLLRSPWVCFTVNHEVQGKTPQTWTKEKLSPVSPVIPRVCLMGKDAWAGVESPW